jgi:acetolactate synthase small subunit
MNMLMKSQYQPRLSGIKKNSPGGLANQIVVFKSNYIITQLHVIKIEDMQSSAITIWTTKSH